MRMRNEKILTANEQETCRAKTWGLMVEGLITETTVASEFCTQPNLTESLVLETSETSYTLTLLSIAYVLMWSYTLSI